MSEADLQIDLFALGQEYFNKFLQEFAQYGIKADPDLALHQGSGLLCYYSLQERQIYLSVPDFKAPTGKLQALFLRSLLGCDTNEEMMHFLRLFIPYIIAHEMAHHFRHRYGLFSDSLWYEEQIASKLAVAVVKHRLTPPQKNYAQQFLQRAIERLAAKMEAKNIAIDSYYSVLHALDASGQIKTADFENIELIQSLFSVKAEEILKDSGQLSDEFIHRLEQRDNLIEDIDEQYAADQIKYIYYHLGWLHLDLTSRETEYIDGFARNYLNITPELLSTIQADQNPDDVAIQACFKAYQEVQAVSDVAARYFYKRYRSLLLNRLQATDLQIHAHTERLKREARLILENWSENVSDTLDYLSQLAPPALRPLFPHLIAKRLAPRFDITTHLPTETDRRLWLHLVQHTGDLAAANMLHRLSLLDQTDIYRPLPAEVMLELTHRFYQVKYNPGDTVIWQHERNDDVFFLIEGELQVLVTEENQDKQVGLIKSGEMFGEIAFFTEDPRYATVRATQPAECFVLTDADLQLFAYQHPTILMQMAGALAKRLADAYRTSRRETV